MLLFSIPSIFLVGDPQDLFLHFESLILVLFQVVRRDVVQHFFQPNTVHHRVADLELESDNPAFEDAVDDARFERRMVGGLDG